MTVSESARPSLGEYKDTMEQASRQNYGSAGHIVEWHYSDEETSKYWAREFQRAGFNNLVVKFTPYDPFYQVHKSYLYSHKYNMLFDKSLAVGA